MPRLRIVPMLLKKGPSLVKGPSFSKSRVIGPALPSIRIYQARDVDELIVIDVSDWAKDCKRVDRFRWLKEVNSYLTMPLTVGGGIRSSEQIQFLIQNGADRVVLNWALRNDQDLVKNAVLRHGSQSIVGSIDVLFDEGRWLIYDSWLGKSLDISLDAFIPEVQGLGVGEILLTSYSNEGQMKGFDLQLLKATLELVEVPFIFSGGAGGLTDFCDLMNFVDNMNANISAIAASSCFHFTQSTPGEVAKCLHDEGFNTRIT